VNSAFVQHYTNKNIDRRTALPQTLAVSVLTERGREEKGRGEELRKGGSSSFTLGRKKKSRHLRGVVCMMMMCSIVYVGFTLPTGDI